MEKMNMVVIYDESPRWLRMSSEERQKIIDAFIEKYESIREYKEE